VRYALLISAFALAGCWLPKDPEGTAEAVQGMILKVGLLEEPVPEVERETLQRIAEEFGAEVEFQAGNPHLLVSALSRGDLHVLAGGIPTNSPFVEETGATNAIGHVTIGPEREERVLLIRPGENRFLFRINSAIRPMTEEAKE
jgi:hypothetical protein